MKTKKLSKFNRRKTQKKKFFYGGQEELIEDQEKNRIKYPTDQINKLINENLPTSLATNTPSDVIETLPVININENEKYDATLQDITSIPEIVVENTPDLDDITDSLSLDDNDLNEMDMTVASIDDIDDTDDTDNIDDTDTSDEITDEIKENINSVGGQRAPAPAPKAAPKPISKPAPAPAPAPKPAGKPAPAPAPKRAPAPAPAPTPVLDLTKPLKISSTGMRIKNTRAPYLGISANSYSILQTHAKQINDNYRILVPENTLKMNEIHRKNTSPDFYTYTNNIDLFEELRIINKTAKGGASFSIPPAPKSSLPPAPKKPSPAAAPAPKKPSPAPAPKSSLPPAPKKPSPAPAPKSSLPPAPKPKKKRPSPRRELEVKVLNSRSIKISWNSYGDTNGRNFIYKISFNDLKIRKIIKKIKYDPKYKTLGATIIGLNPNTAYTIAVYASAKNIDSLPSNMVKIKTPAEYVPFDFTAGYIENDYSFSQFNKYADFAKINNLKMRGHTLVYHSAMPQWILPLTRDQAIIAVMRHVYSVVSYYKRNYPGVVFCYDVVNEHHASPYYNPPWMSKTSDGMANINDTYYIEAAFIAAHKADPTAKLYICDYNCESTWGDNETFQILKNIVKNLKNKYKAVNLKFPIHGVAFQGHYILDLVIGANPLKNNNYIKGIAAYIKDILKREIDQVTNELGLEFQFTEIDIVNWIRVIRLPGSSGYSKEDHDYMLNSIKSTYGGKNGWDATAINNFNIMQAEFLKQLYIYLKSNPKCTAISFWGLNDKVSWIQPDFIEHFGMPTIFDINNNPKPSYYALKSVL